MFGEYVGNLNFVGGVFLVSMGLEVLESVWVGFGVS